MFYFDELNGSKILRSNLLGNKDVDVFFTTRDGYPLDKNFAKRIITPEQVHGDNVEIVDARETYPSTDGLIINKTEIAICLRFADCTPLIFYDKENHIAAISHAGWRGTAAKIGVKTINKMVADFGTKPNNVIAIIGPAIGKCCYEVSEDVKKALLDTVSESDDLFEDRNVDLKRINAKQLQETGVLSIDICPYCTSCNNDLFYSYRKENQTKNRHFAILKLL